MNSKIPIIYLFLIYLLSACKPFQTSENKENDLEEEKVVLSGLPFRDLIFDKEFESKNPSWQSLANLSYDFQGTHTFSTTEGEGLLFALAAEDGQTAVLETGIEHQDIDLQFDFVLPEDGYATLLLHGMFEVELKDSWNKKVDFSGQIASAIPEINACKAPGLWQQVAVKFEAPRFDPESKVLIKKALLKEVSLNGRVLHKNIELDTPAPSELGPLQIKASPNTAIRDFKYKTYGLDTLRLENIRYELFFGDWDVLPDFSGLEVADTGTAQFLDVGVAGQPDKYALKFYGDLYVPRDGEYFIQSMIDDGGDIFVDGKLVLHNDGEPNEGTEQTLTQLTAGKHDFEMTYFQDHWGSAILLSYEGPEISKNTLASDPRITKWLDFERPPFALELKDKPELLRGFAHYKGKKKTHVISVGNPQGIHYLYDLENIALLKAWRGGFADVSNMWVGRGASQLMQPLNASIELAQGLAVARLNKKTSLWPANPPEDYKSKGYTINKNGMPVFKYLIGNDEIKDEASPSPDKLGINRTISINNSKSNYWCKLAEGKQITALESGLFDVDGQYYIEILSAGAFHLQNDQTLIASFKDAKVSYKILW